MLVCFMGFATFEKELRAFGDSKCRTSLAFSCGSCRENHGHLTLQPRHTYHALVRPVLVQ